MNNSQSSSRLLSLDALRGFDMFWLLGGGAIVRLLAKDATEGSALGRLGQQFTHVKWDGFQFYDFIFPLFLFLIGVAVPLSISKRLARGDSKGKVFRHALIRFWWMVFCGWLIHGNLLSWDPQKMRLSYSVLMMLGFGYLIAVALVLWTSLRTQIIVTAAILVGYWAAQMFVPVPGHVAGQFKEGCIFSDWVYDYSIALLGKPWSSHWGRGWPVTLWTHGATAMLGVFAAYVIQSPQATCDRLLRLVVLGAGCLLAGWLWSFHLPIVKVRWSSSYVLWCAGWSYLLVAVFHWVIDIKGWRKWAGLFVAIGSNSILAYLTTSLFMGAFRAIATTLFDGWKLWMNAYWHGVWMAVATYGLAWLFFIYLHRRKLYLRL
ncbi:MAG: DUF5009 domain-containing protein [Verrucomicrobia bacterium]|nr:DUF5009 domain-containing protein [Verrucomicrobiota bacterium]